MMNRRVQPAARQKVTMDLKPGNTAAGKLAPFQVAKAVAYEQVISSMERHMGKTCWELLGQSKAQFTAEQLTVVGGGSPSDRAVKKHWAKTKNDPKWFPGRKVKSQAGRPCQITDGQKKAIADKAMELKKSLVAPTPERVRICLPRKTINKATTKPISNKMIHKIFSTMCYDGQEDDPWQYLNSRQQDAFTDQNKPGRVKIAQHVMGNVSEAT